MTNTVPQKKIASLSEFEQKALQQFNSALTFLKNHSTFSITLIYLFLSIVGLVHLIILSNFFDINILPHLEISDFILAPIRSPLVIVFFLIISIGGWLGQKLELKLRKKKKVEKVYNKINKPFYSFNPLITYSIIISLLAFVSLNMSSELTYENIIEEKTQHYNISLTAQVELKSNQVEHLADVQIIADTVKYLWIYINDSGQIHAIPQKSIASLIPIMNKDKSNEEEEKSPPKAG